MRRAPNSSGASGEHGYALVFALAVMLVVLVVGMRFVAVAHSRHAISDNEHTALQARMIADAALQRVARELGQNMAWSGSFSDEPFAGGTYSGGIVSRGADYVLAWGDGTLGTVTRHQYGVVSTPASSGSVRVWASLYGTGANEWKNKENLIDSAEGETGTYAYHKLGEGADQMSLAGLGSDIRSVPITKVEVVISGYVDNNPINDYLTVEWTLPSDGASGTTHTWPSATLSAHVGSGAAGRMYLDITSDAPPGGWQWEHFHHGTDLELRFASDRIFLDDNVKLYVDCAGLRITWNAGL